MRRLGFAVILIAAACGDDAGSEPDARPPGDASHADASAPDASAPDAAAPDAGPVDDCPNRTAPRGEPQGTIPPAAIRSGDVTIRSALDVTALTGIRAVTGNVIVDAPTFTTLSLPDLEVVGGRFVIGFRGAIGMLTTVELPRLETVGGDVGNTVAVSRVSAPRLEQANGASFRAPDIDVHCFRDSGLGIVGYTGAALPLAKYETGTLAVSQVPNLTRLDAPRWREGGLDVQNAPALTAIAAPLNPASLIRLITAPQLASVDLAPITTLSELQLAVLAIPDLSFLQGLTRVNGGIGITDTPIRTLGGLESLTFAVSVVLGGNGNLVDTNALSAVSFVSSLWATDNPALATLSLPQVPTLDTGLRVERNQALTRLSFPALTRVLGEFIVTNNPNLPNCQATGLRALVTGSPDTTISGNGTGTCP